jgi:hypothetical protein
MITPTLICRDDEHIERFEPAREPEPWMTTIGHGPARLPLRILAAGNG